MQEQGRTFEEVAIAAGVSVRTVYNAADGINSNRGTRKLIAAALDTSVEALWPIPTSVPSCPPAPAEAVG